MFLSTEILCICGAILTIKNNLQFQDLLEAEGTLFRLSLIVAHHGWEIRIDVKFNSIKTDTHYNIIRLNAIEGHGGKIGQRIPGFWTVKGMHNKLTIHTNIDDNGMRVFTNELGTFECHKWYHFVISQKKTGVIKA